MHFGHFELWSHAELYLQVVLILVLFMHSLAHMPHANVISSLSTTIEMFSQEW